MKALKSYKKTPLLAVCLTCLLVVGCDEPRHVVIENGSLVIYQAKERDDDKVGRFEYWVRDNSTKGWVFITDTEYQVGDVLQVSKAGN